MMRLLPLLLISGSAALTAVSQTPPSTQNPRPDTQTPARPDAGRVEVPQDKRLDKADAKQVDGFLATWVVIGNEGEIALAQIAQQKATDPEVKQFAQMVIDDHQKFVQRLQSFTTGVRSGGGAVGDTTGAPKTGNERQDALAQPRSAAMGDMSGFDHVGLIEDLGQQCLQSARRELEQKQGAEFDRCYVGMSVGGHMKANDALTVFQKHASGSLKPLLADGQRTTSAHLEKAKSLAKRLDGKGGDVRDPQHEREVGGGN